MGSENEAGDDRVQPTTRLEAGASRGDSAATGLPNGNGSGPTDASTPPTVAPPDLPRSGTARATPVRVRTVAGSQPAANARRETTTNGGSPASTTPTLTVMGQAEAKEILPDLARRIATRKVSFDDVFACYYDAYPISAAIETTPSPMLPRQLAARTLLDDALDAFDAVHKIEGIFWCERIESAGVLNRTPGKSSWGRREDEWDIRFSLDWKAEDKDIMPFFNRCTSLTVRTDRLPYVERVTAKRLIFEAFSSALDALDKRRERPDGLTQDELDELDGQVAEATTYYRGSATAQANTLYFLGTLWGAAALLIVYDLASGILALRGEPDLLGPMSPLLLSFGAGAAGATLSVMQRMGSKEGLVQDYEAPAATLRLFGMLRPLIGGAVGSIFHVLVLAGLLPLAVPTTSTALPYFFIGVAFLAGFSERWAKDILAKPPAGIAASDGDATAATQPNSQPKAT